MCNFGLYAEQLSGSAFTVPRTGNQRVWLYRKHPSAGHSKFTPRDDLNNSGKEETHFHLKISFNFLSRLTSFPNSEKREKKRPENQSNKALIMFACVIDLC